jgi:GNAT superfamily N-acetyltransferase
VRSQTLASDRLRFVPIRCRKCRAEITRLRAVADNNSPVYCADCLPGDATLGQRLKTCRLSAGLTLAELERRSGVGRMLISSYEEAAKQRLSTWAWDARGCVRRLLVRLPARRVPVQKPAPATRLLQKRSDPAAELDGGGLL